MENFIFCAVNATRDVSEILPPLIRHGRSAALVYIITYFAEISVYERRALISVLSRSVFSQTFMTVTLVNYFSKKLNHRC